MVAMRFLVRFAGVAAALLLAASAAHAHSYRQVTVVHGHGGFAPYGTSYVPATGAAFVPATGYHHLSGAAFAPYGASFVPATGAAFVPAGVTYTHLAGA